MARLESARLLIALAVSHGWEVHHMDVKSAFLNGVLYKYVYGLVTLGVLKNKLSLPSLRNKPPPIFFEIAKLLSLN